MNFKNLAVFATLLLFNQCCLSVGLTTTDRPKTKNLSTLNEMQLTLALSYAETLKPSSGEGYHAQHFNTRLHKSSIVTNLKALLLLCTNVQLNVPDEKLNETPNMVKWVAHIRDELLKEKFIRTTYDSLFIPDSDPYWTSEQFEKH